MDEERLNEKVSRTVVDYKNCLMKFYNFIPTDSFNLSRASFSSFFVQIFSPEFIELI